MAVDALFQTIWAPAAMHAAATLALKVSTEMRTSGFSSLTRSMTPMTRESSLSAETYSAPGRVDWPE